MVYFGLPSKACLSCRKRRIKCDLSIPSCSQCLRSARICSDYRNVTDLRFLDQSQQIVIKAKKKLNTNMTASPRTLVDVIATDQQQPSPEKAMSSSSRESSPDSIIESCLTLPLEDQAFLCFYNNYPCYPSRNFKNYFMDVAALCSIGQLGSPILDIVSALGLSTLSHTSDQSGLEPAAIWKYGTALHKVNARLQDPNLARSDETLFVVLLLGLYETNNCKNKNSVKAWLHHIQGAAMLLALRGRDQLTTRSGRALFTHARIQIITACYQTRSPIPEVLIRLSHQHSEIESNPVESLANITMQFCNVRSGTKFNPTPGTSEQSIQATVESFTMIAQAYQDWFDMLPVEFHPTLMPVPNRGAECISSHYEVYEDIWTAGIVNNYRVNAMLAHEALISQLLFLRQHYAQHETTKTGLQISTSRCVLEALVNDICASVPDLLRSQFAAAGIALIWPLSVSAQLSPKTFVLGKKTRDWIVARLEVIGAQMGVCQATKLVEILRRGDDITGLTKDIRE